LTQTDTIPEPYTAALILPDGCRFFGYGIGAQSTTFGEICFNTAMTGYQEILTDPSYAGQIVTFTAPHIGNTGCNSEDMESRESFVAGLILRELPTEASNFRSEENLNQWLSENGITGICGIDTRALTRHIRLNGATNIAICYPANGKAEPLSHVEAALKEHPSMAGMDLAKQVTTDAPYHWKQTTWKLEGGYGELQHPKYKVAVIDYGEKYNILRLLADEGCDLQVFPADTDAKTVLATKPDGIFLSNGPGDPAATGAYALPAIKEYIASGKPVFGICLGHQLLSIALGGQTEKMFQGHRGANHPVQCLDDKTIAITSQNHGFATKHNSLPATAEVTHLSLFDGTIQGVRLKGKPVFGVQYHPEGSPGPHDSHNLFRQFAEAMHAA
jgi:carbamoyl-phosphate synthase small subunit